MPAVDEAGRRLMLSAMHMLAVREAAGLLDPEWILEDDGDAVRDARGRLVATGLMDAGGDLHPLLGDLVDCMTRPSCRLVIDVSGPQGVSVADVVVSGDRVWSDEPWPGAGRTTDVVRRRSDLPALLFTVSRGVGLRPADALSEPAVTSTLRNLAATLATLADPHLAWDDAKAAAIAGFDALAPVPESGRTRWITLLAALQGSWRVTCQWGDPDVHGDRAGVRGVAVLDCGTEGYWERVDPAEPVGLEDLKPDIPVRLEPVSAGDLWDRLAGILPSGAELRALRDVAGAAS